MKQEKAHRVLPRDRTGHSKHPLPTTQEKTLHMDITGWSTPKSDWLYFLQPNMERLYTVNKKKTRSWLHLNAEFQRIARRDKKAFFSNQCEAIEGNNRMGKTRDLFKKIRHTKGIFHGKMDTIKDRNGMTLTDAEDSKKRSQEYTEVY